MRMMMMMLMRRLGNRLPWSWIERGECRFGGHRPQCRFQILWHDPLDAQFVGHLHSAPRNAVTFCFAIPRVDSHDLCVHPCLAVIGQDQHILTCHVLMLAGSWCGYSRMGCCRRRLSNPESRSSLNRGRVLRRWAASRVVWRCALDDECHAASDRGCEAVKSTSTQFRHASLGGLHCTMAVEVEESWMDAIDVRVGCNLCAFIVGRSGECHSGSDRSADHESVIEVVCSRCHQCLRLQMLLRWTELMLELRMCLKRV
mmetsp:Transcript_23259/g.51049  ORF Transcript_23259/g.51049 Transcript_23259/m.51049 type:complete len:257 (-) Transcript_23259:420-1190(-)